MGGGGARQACLPEFASGSRAERMNYFQIGFFYCYFPFFIYLLLSVLIELHTPTCFPYNVLEPFLYLLLLKC